MSSQSDLLYDRIAEVKSLPIGFFGSGFSQRYLGAPTWQKLLEMFAERNGRSYNYYSGKAVTEPEDKLPEIANLIASDLFDPWFESDLYRESRERFEHQVVDISDPLKYEISQYLKALPTLPQDHLVTEREKLSSVQLHAVVTTNWDTFLDDTFSDLETYIGQEKLIFSDSFAIGETYKIHGCVTDPTSLVLTTADYEKYEERNVYLVSKLLTLFVEHPIVFFGYSITDTNIRKIFRQIIGFLSQDQINQLANRIIFVNRTKHNRPAAMQQSSLDFGRQNLTVWHYITDDLAEVYDVLARLPRHYPVQFLRRLRSDVVSLTMSSDPNTMIKVVDFDDDTELDKVEVVIGVGMAAKLSAKGYIGYKRIDLARDMLNADGNHDKIMLLENALPGIMQGTKLVPLHYPLFIAGRLDSDGKLEDRTDLPTVIEQAVDNPIQLVSHLSRGKEHRGNQHFRDMLNEGSDIAVGYGILAKYDMKDIVALRDFLLVAAYPDFPKGKFITAYWRLVCLYDRMVFGTEWYGDRQGLHDALGIQSLSVTTASSAV